MINNPIGDHLVDLVRVSSWMDDQNLGSGPIGHVELLTGGTQNFLLKFERDGRQFVLRRPPEFKRPNSDDTMRREARVLSALATSDVPHPGFIAGCDSLDVIGAAFYLMEPVDGFNPSVGLSDSYVASSAMQHQMGLAMANGISALGNVDHIAVGLGDFGKASGWLERQVDRWGSHLDSYAAFENYPGHGITGVDDVAAWLRANQPAQWVPGIIHGDFHFANVMFRFDEPALAAIVDWELATIGDPLLDLGHLLATWPTAGSPSAVASIPHLPTIESVIDHYGANTKRDMTQLPWYRVLACYRLGIILEGTNARAYAGLAPRATGNQLHATTIGLFKQAQELIGAAR